MHFLKQQRHLILFGSLAVIMMAIIGFFVLQTKAEEKWVPLTVSSESSVQTSEAKVIMVDIKGQIAKPGVYQLTTDSRLNTLVEMAGGLTAEADQKQLNLAMKLQDQQMIYVPHREETVEAAPVANATDPTDAVINLNTADHDQLQELAGIGEKKAQAIIAYREENGPFTNIEELMEISGIGEKTFERLREQLTV